MIGVILRAAFPWLLGAAADGVGALVGLWNSNWIFLLVGAAVVVGHWMVWPRSPR